jgi:hypothetical protein
MFALATVSLTSTASSIVFDNIPQNYSHLQLRIMARTTQAGATDGLRIFFNTDTTNYRTHALIGNGSSASTADVGYINIGDTPGATATAGIFGCMILDILDYPSSSKNKVLRTLAGQDQNGSGSSRLLSGLWFGTPTAITKIILNSANDANLAIGSHIALYGIKTV